MPRAVNFMIVCLIVWSCSCARTPDTLIEGGYDEQEMDAAISEARQTVDRFITELEAGNGSDFAVKVPIEDGGKTEHFWLTDIVLRDDKFHGVIGNDPGVVSNVTFGQEWSVGKTEITDWMFMRNDKMYGNYTVRPLLKTMPEEQAAQVRSMLADP